MNLAKIKAKAQGIMKEHKIKKVYATADGQVFLPNKKQAADFHAKQNSGLKVYEIKREEEKPQPKVDDKDNKKEDSKKKK